MALLLPFLESPLYLFQLGDLRLMIHMIRYKDWQVNSDTRPADAKNIEHDYAVIELAKVAGNDYMRFTISPDLTQFNGRIHFR